MAKHNTERLKVLDDAFKSGKEFTRKQLQELVIRKLYSKGQVPKALERTIQDDLKAHQEQPSEWMGRVLFKKKGRTPIYSYDPNAEQYPTNKLTPDQVNMLGFLLRALDQANVFPKLEDLYKILCKMTGYPEDVSFSGDSNGVLFLDDRHFDYVGNQHILKLCKYINSKQTIRIFYQPFTKDQPTIYTMHPYEVREYNHRFYVCGLVPSELPNKLFNLALDRIKDVQPDLDIPYIEKPEAFENYYDDMVGLTKPDNATIETVELAFSANRAQYVITKPIHRSQKPGVQLPDGRIKIKLKLYINQELKSTLLSFGADCEVLAPASLRAWMKEYHTISAAQYN